jgi:hypothetical protein
MRSSMRGQARGTRVSVSYNIFAEQFANPTHTFALTFRGIISITGHKGRHACLHASYNIFADPPRKHMRYISRNILRTNPRTNHIPIPADYYINTPNRQVNIPTINMLKGKTKRKSVKVAVFPDISVYRFYFYFMFLFFIHEVRKKPLLLHFFTLNTTIMLFVNIIYKDTQTSLQKQYLLLYIISHTHTPPQQVTYRQNTLLVTTPTRFYYRRL